MDFLYQNVRNSRNILSCKFWNKEKWKMLQLCTIVVLLYLLHCYVLSVPPYEDRLFAFIAVWWEVLLSYRNLISKRGRLMSDFVYLWINCHDRVPVYWRFCDCGQFCARRIRWLKMQLTRFLFLLTWSVLYFQVTFRDSYICIERWGWRCCSCWRLLRRTLVRVGAAAFIHSAPHVFDNQSSPLKCSVLCRKSLK